MTRPTLALLLLTSCSVSSVATDDTDTDTDTPQDTDDTEVEVEEIPCEVLDCEDPDCSDRFQCTWPDEQTHRSEVTFTGNRIQCRFLGATVPYDVPDCATSVAAHLVLRTGGDTCDVCDRTYEGTFEYLSDTCAKLLGGAAALDGAWGFVFIDPDTRELFLPGAEGGWVSQGEVVRNQRGLFELDWSQELYDNPPDCRNGEQHLGDLAIQASFRDGPPPE